MLGVSAGIDVDVDVAIRVVQTIGRRLDIAESVFEYAMTILIHIGLEEIVVAAQSQLLQKFSCLDRHGLLVLQRQLAVLLGLAYRQHFSVFGRIVDASFLAGNFFVDSFARIAYTSFRDTAC